MRPCIGDNTTYCVQSYHSCPGIDMSNLEAVILLMKNHLQQLPENNQQETLTLMNSPVEGRGLFAVRDIFPGELIFVDHPLIYGPRISEDVTISCVNCYDSVKALHTCTCGLPICSEECQNSPEHKSECKLIGSWKPRTTCIDSNAFARNVVPIRALLLSDHQKDFLKSLAVHDSPQHGAEVRFIKKHFEISDEEEVLMMQACRALDANAYEMFKKTKTDRSVNLRGLFPISALLNHACSPNTRNSFDYNGMMYVKASTYIPEGAEIFTSYTGLLWGTPVRRHHLKNTKHFLCDCSRCCDRTEFGTKLAAMRCLNRSCSGISLPDDPLNYSSSWVCDTCDLHIPPVQVGSLQTAIAKLIGSVEMNTPDDINDFVSGHLTKFLPESNHIVLELKCRIIWALGSTEGYKWHELSATWLRRAEELCRGLLATCTTLRLQSTPLVARLLLRLHHCLLEKLRRLRNADLELTTQEILNLKKEIMGCIQISYDILNGDVSAPKDLETSYKQAESNVEKLLNYNNDDN